MKTVTLIVIMVLGLLFLIWLVSLTIEVKRLKDSELENQKMTKEMIEEINWLRHRFDLIVALNKLTTCKPSKGVICLDPDGLGVRKELKYEN